ncbi:MAG: hypothetical protein JWN93_3677 [Hyphomicrobiales bacterium]|nr:hypothetical protein [Hyphomicrobiales bacterium]
MALVTIGVPVFNGADLIGECLESLSNQSLRDIEIVVSDNASTDGTREIVEDWAARDPRIRYIRQPVNLGLMGNFKAVFEAARSPYFIFRCHDDLSSLDYAEKLYDAIRATPGARLAVANVETYRGGELVRVHRVPQLGRDNALLNVRELLFKSHAAWFCGLWETEALRPVLQRVWAVYDSPWGPDHLTIYSFLIDQRVALAPDATFIQRITPKAGENGYKKPKLQQMMALRRAFIQQCREFRRERGFGSGQEAALRIMTWFYAGKRVFKARNIVRYALLGRW